MNDNNSENIDKNELYTILNKFQICANYSVESMRYRILNENVMLRQVPQ